MEALKCIAGWSQRKADHAAIKQSSSLLMVQENRQLEKTFLVGRLLKNHSEEMSF